MKQRKFKLRIRVVALLVLACFCSSQPLEILAKSRNRGFDAFGMAGSAALIASTPMSGRSISTMIRNNAIAYAVPKYLNKPLGKLGASFVGGALSGGFALGQGGFDFKWNNKAMLTQGVTSMATVGVTNYGYEHGWDRKLPGISNLAGNVAGNFGLWGTNKLLKVDWGTLGGKVAFADYGKSMYITGGREFKLPSIFHTPGGGAVNIHGAIDGNLFYDKGDKNRRFVSSPATFNKHLTQQWGFNAGGIVMNKYVPEQLKLREIGFSSWAKPQLSSFLKDTFRNTAVEYARLYTTNKFTPSHNQDVRFYHQAAGSMTSGVFSGMLNGQGLARGLAKGFVSGVTSAGLTHLSREWQKAGFGPHSAAIMNLGLSAGIRGALSSPAGSRWDLTKSVFKNNMMQAVGNFGTFGLATLTPTGDLYYFKPPDASFYSGMHDFFRTAEGMPNSSWTKYDWKRYDTTGKIPENTKGFGNALASRFSSCLHYQAVSNIATLFEDKLGKITYKKIDGEWMRVKPVDINKIAEDLNRLKNIQGGQITAPLWNPYSFSVSSVEQPLVNIDPVKPIQSAKISFSPSGISRPTKPVEPPKFEVRSTPNLKFSNDIGGTKHNNQHDWGVE